VPSSLFDDSDERRERRDAIRGIASCVTPGTAVFTHLTSLSRRSYIPINVFLFSEGWQLRRLRLVGGSACEYLPALQGLSQLVDVDLDNVFYEDEGAAIGT
jgi:hypothetical protein